uniref:Uncharacterized protein n=1 Tax=Ditylenchus dipsaci TaxID=166011 RepID=A0A915ECS3_9BILA
MMVFEKRDEKAISLMMYVSEDTMLNPVLPGHRSPKWFGSPPAVLLPGAEMKERNRCVKVTNPDYGIIELRKECLLDAYLSPKSAL